jgi:cell division protein FtsB
VPRASSQKPGRIWLRRLAWSAGVIAALFFTIEGGEYGTRDLWTQKGRKARLDAEVAQLRRDVDSLQQELKAIRTDDRRLEHLAREEYGMVKGSKELLYRVERDGASAADSAAADSSRNAKRD